MRWSGQYGSFGEMRHQSKGFSRVVNRTAMAHQPLRYAGQYADGENGLHYNLFRYYDPQVGRFIVHDPNWVQWWVESLSVCAESVGVD